MKREEVRVGRLQEKVALVTGAGRGIGRGIAKRFAEEGAAVAVVDLRGETAEATARELKHGRREAIAIEADVASSEDVERVVKRVLSHFGRIDILVNNAGMGGSRPCTETTEESWERMVAVNLRSVFLLCRSVIPEMLKEGRGKIINIGSIFGMGGASGTLAYSASKAGVINVTRQLAVDYSQKGICVNSISPGLIETDMTREKLGETARRDHLVGLIPLGRIGTPDDIARAAVFLASEDSDFITGHNLVVDGGQTIRME